MHKLGGYELEWIKIFSRVAIPPGPLDTEDDGTTSLRNFGELPAQRQTCISSKTNARTSNLTQCNSVRRSESSNVVRRQYLGLDSICCAQSVLRT